MDLSKLFIKETKIDQNPNKIQEYFVEEGIDQKHPNDIINYVFLGDKKLNVELIQQSNSFTKAKKYAKFEKIATVDCRKTKKEVTIAQLEDILNKKMSCEEAEDEPRSNFSGILDEHKYSIDKKLFKLYQLFNKFHNKEIANFLTKTEILKRKSAELIDNDSKYNETDKLKSVLENVFNLKKLEDKTKGKRFARFKKDKQKLEERILKNPVDSQIKKYIQDKFLFYQSDINENCIKTQIDDLFDLGPKQHQQQNNNWKQIKKNQLKNLDTNDKNKIDNEINYKKYLDTNDSSDESNLSDFCNWKYKNYKNNNGNNYINNLGKANTTNNKNIGKPYDSIRSFAELGTPNYNQKHNKKNNSPGLGLKRNSSINFKLSINKLKDITPKKQGNRSSKYNINNIKFETPNKDIETSNLDKEVLTNENIDTNKINFNSNLKRYYKSVTKDFIFDNSNIKPFLDFTDARFNRDTISEENKNIKLAEDNQSFADSEISIKPKNLELMDCKEPLEEVKEKESVIVNNNRPIIQDVTLNDFNNKTKIKNIFNFINSEEKNKTDNNMLKNITKSVEKKENNASAGKKQKYTERGFEFKTYGVNKNRLFSYLEQITKNSKGTFLDFKQKLPIQTIQKFYRQENITSSVKDKINEKQNFHKTTHNTKDSLNSLFNFGHVFKSAKDMNNLNNNTSDKKLNFDMDEKEINFDNNKNKSNKHRNNMELHMNGSLISCYPIFSNEKVVAGKCSRNPFANNKHPLKDFSTEEFVDNLKLNNNLYSSLDFQENFDKGIF